MDTFHLPQTLKLNVVTIQTYLAVSWMLLEARLMVSQWVLVVLEVVLVVVEVDHLDMC